MALENFPYAGLARPAPGTASSTTPRVLRANFGDGYAQRVGDGINTLDRKVKLQFRHITWAERDAMEAFLNRHAGYRSFLFWYPGDPAPAKWIAPSWSSDIADFNVASMQIDFERVFDN